MDLSRSVPPTRSPGLSTRAHLLLLVIALLVPVLAFAGVLALRYAAVESAAFRQEAIDTARRIAAQIDRDLGGLQIALQTLSTSARIRTGEYEVFHRQIVQVRGFIGEHIVLRDLAGQQLASTRLPWGAPLPRSVLEPDAEVIENRRPVVSGVFTGAVAGAPLFAIVVPVLQDGRVTHLLNLSIPIERLRSLLREGLRAEWTSGAVDRKGVPVMSSRGDDAAHWPIPTDFLGQTTAPEGLWRGTDRHGVPVLVAYSHSNLTGWRVWAGVPEAALAEPLTQKLWMLALLGVALVGASLVMAYAVASRIAGSIRGLATSAAGLGRGETVLPAPSSLREANEVTRALSAASIGLRERARERDHAEAAMRASETRFRQLAEALPQLVWIMQADGTTIYCNQRCQEFYGEAGKNLAGRASLIHPDDRPAALKMRAEAIAAGRLFQVMVRLRPYKGGPYRWYLLSVVPLDGEGEGAAWVGTATDIDDLRRAEETNARLAAIVTASADAMMSFSVDGRIESWNPAAEALFGYAAEEAIGATASLLVSPDNPKGPRGAFDRAIAGETVRTDTVRVAKSGERIEVAITATPIRASDGSIVGVSAVMRDIRAEKAIERRQQLLINELNHRVKNTLATVQAIAAQTLRSGGTDAEARDAFEARLLALSKVHNVLTRQNWESVSLADIIAEVLAPHGGEDPARFRIAGPDVRLEPRMALPLAMALHELATNAVKYGALASGTGRVTLEWSVKSAPDGPLLRLRWAEEGGPAVTPPGRKGFGSRLIERSLALELGGKVDLDFAPTGVVCTIEALLTQDSASAPQKDEAARRSASDWTPRAASA